jgi:hypothetical protein
MSINQISTSNTFAQWLVATQALIEKSNFYEDTTNLVFDTANSITIFVNDSTNTINLIIETADGNINSFVSNSINTINEIIEDADVNISSFVSNSIIDITGVYNNTVIVFENTQNVYSNTVIVFNDTNNVYIDIQSYVATAYDTANTVNLIANEANTTATLALITANAALDASNTFFETIFNIQDETINVNTFYVTFVNDIVGVPEDVYVSSTKLNFTPSTGNLYSTISSSQNVVTGNVTASGLVTSQNVVTGNVTASGLVTAQDFNSTSDISLKENITQIENSLDILEKLTGIKFNWKNTQEISYGLSAQEVEQVLPEIVKTRENGLKGVNYLNIIAILIESVKELKNEIEILKKHK